MKKPFAFLYCFFILSSGAFCQNIPSPGSFLGYTPGSRFTAYARIAGYFRAVAQAAPDRVKLEQYGQTYEGRPLLLAYIASPENLRRLESIRLNNLRLAGVVNDSVHGGVQVRAHVKVNAI